jgi:hypothetical protein
MVAGAWSLGGADLAEQAAQEPGDLHERAAVAGPLLRSALGVLERRHWVAHDAQVVLPRDLARSLADAEQLAEAGSPRASEEFESGHPGGQSLQRAH